MKESKKSLGFASNRDYLVGTKKEAAPTTSNHSLWETLLTSTSNFDFPRKEKVPAGYYIAEIVDVAIRSKAARGSNEEKVLLDVSYVLEGFDVKNDGLIYHIKQSYPAGTVHLRNFFTAMGNAGANIHTDPKNLVGIKEKIHLAYESDYSDIGSIVERVPYVGTPPTDDLDEDYDYLDEDDD